MSIFQIYIDTLFYFNDKPNFQKLHLQPNNLVELTIQYFKYSLLLW